MIRGYLEKDKENCRRICHATATAPKYVADKELVCALYCDYYIEVEADNCFVLTDEFDNAVGYILCAENQFDFETAFKPYLQKAGKRSKADKIGHILECRLNKKLYRKYPAHLHIDILPSFQGKGGGKKLIAELEKHLRLKGVKGIRLGVGADNLRAHKFYEREGYSLVRNLGPFGKVYAKSL